MGVVASVGSVDPGRDRTSREESGSETSEAPSSGGKEVSSARICSLHGVFYDFHLAIGFLARRQRFDYAEPVKVFIGGRAINSEFSITGSARDWEVVLESRSGPARNLDYAPGLEAIFGRFAFIGGELIGAELATKPAMELAPDERRLQIESRFPVQLHDVDIRQLRLEFRKAQKAIRTSPTRKSGGDGANKMRLWFKLPRVPVSDQGLIDLVQGGSVDEDATAVYANPGSRDAVRRLGQGFMSDLSSEEED